MVTESADTVLTTLGRWYGKSYLSSLSLAGVFPNTSSGGSCSMMSSSTARSSSTLICFVYTRSVSPNSMFCASYMWSNKCIRLSYQALLVSISTASHRDRACNVPTLPSASPHFSTNHCPNFRGSVTNDVHFSTN
ncbi:hypothetical protein NP493_68g03017 [Ridgeia piscesae]|uniref:Uncharacterized protein n=1 Tax=Ridgeia piscesae TaxID=27915 RepID=A0AAD9UIT4_RIDPI|nr:hypothetical protein NP493_68g03017 [Ridgeia piscesae]